MFALLLFEPHLLGSPYLGDVHHLILIYILLIRSISLFSECAEMC